MGEFPCGAAWPVPGPSHRARRRNRAPPLLYKKNTWQMRKISWLQVLRSYCWRQHVANENQLVAAPPLLMARTRGIWEKSADCSAAVLVGANTLQMRKISWLQGSRYGWRQHGANENQLITGPPRANTWQIRKISWLQRHHACWRQHVANKKSVAYRSAAVVGATRVIW